MIPLPQDRRFVTPEQFCRAAMDGDTLFCWPDGPVEEVIAKNDKPYAHAAMVGHNALGLPTCIEVTIPRGKESLLADWLALRPPGTVDLYPIDGSRIDRAKAVEGMRTRVGVRYGYWSLLRGAVYVLWLKLLGRSLPRKAPAPLDCSGSVLYELRAAAIDPTVYADLPTNCAKVSPSQLARSQDSQYAATAGSPA